MKKILIGSPEFLKNIDWTLLRNQKTTLLMLTSTVNKDITNDLDGIVHLIDAIQDYAVDEMEIPEMYVYDFELEENRDKETDEERFARENAETVFEMCTEGDSLYIDDENNELQMGKEFIDKVINDKYSADMMKLEIRRAILKGVTEHPEDFERDENGKFCYDYRLCEDFGGIIDNYLKNEYESTHTRTIQLCSNCASDNVVMEAWVNPNKENEFKGTIFKELPTDSGKYCLDCRQHIGFIETEMALNKKLIGFQVINVDSEEETLHEKMVSRNSVYSLRQALNMLYNSETVNAWKLVAIWSGDIENPVMCFNGDPRD